MFIILIVSIVIFTIIATFMYYRNKGKEIAKDQHLTEFDKINAIEDPLLRQIAINDWLNKRV